MNALHWACSCDELAVVSLLLDDSRVTRDARSTHGMTALHHAAVANAMRVLPVLLADRSVFDMESTNEWGESPLHLAAAAGHKAAVRVLLDAGASVVAADRWGRTPSRVAQQQGLQPATLGLPREAVLQIC